MSVANFDIHFPTDREEDTAVSLALLSTLIADKTIDVPGASQLNKLIITTSKKFVVSVFYIYFFLKHF